jgi:hypothetical protein
VILASAKEVNGRRRGGGVWATTNGPKEGYLGFASSPSGLSSAAGNAEAPEPPKRRLRPGLAAPHEAPVRNILVLFREIDAATKNS